MSFEAREGYRLAPVMGFQELEKYLADDIQLGMQYGEKFDEIDWGDIKKCFEDQIFIQDCDAQEDLYDNKSLCCQFKNLPSYVNSSYRWYKDGIFWSFNYSEHCIVIWAE